VEDALGGCESDFVILLNVSEGAEERVAMTRNHHVSRSTRERCSWDVPHRFLEDTLAVTFQHHNRNTEFGNFHPPN
jgi:hypothetical protein